MSTETLNLNEELYSYLKNTSLREPEVLQKLRNETQTMHGAVMQISPEEGQFMGLLITLMGAKKTLDIGTFTGYSALSVALALPPDGKVISCDVDKNATDVAQKYWKAAGVDKKISLQLGDATKTLQALIDKGEAGTFDFAFIDADKNNYDVYYEQALKLLRKGGLIVIDNVLWSGKVADPDVNDAATTSIRALNEKVLKDNRVMISLLPLSDGVTLARKM